MDLPLSQIRAFFAADRFAAETGVVLESADESSVVCSLALQSRHLNAAGIAQGGAIFTLADFCFAVHANLPYLAGEREAPTVGQSNSISFLRPGTGARLIARSACLSRGKSAAVFRVDVEDEKGRLVAAMTGNGLAAAKKPG